MQTISAGCIQFWLVIYLLQDNNSFVMLFKDLVLAISQGLSPAINTRKLFMHHILGRLPGMLAHPAVCPVSTSPLLLPFCEKSETQVLQCLIQNHHLKVRKI
jgi:hypothetical protein